VKTLLSIMIALLGAGASVSLALAGDDGAPSRLHGMFDRLPVVDVTRFPVSGPQPVPMPRLPAPRLRIERLDGTLLVDVQPFDEHGQARGEAFAAIAKAFRARSGDEKPIDPRLVEVLMTLSRAFDDRPIALVSGHRVPGRGTSKTSYHTRGMAADIAIRGVKVHRLRKAAIRLGAWGVGVYPSFVHVDVRKDRPFRWVGGTYGGWRRAR